MRKPESAGMVDWGALNISDSDSSTAQVARRSRKNKARASSDPTESEPEQRQSSEDDEFEQSEPTGRRSLRLTSKRQQQAFSDEGLASSDDSNSLPRRRGRPRQNPIEQTMTTGRSKRKVRQSIMLSDDDEDTKATRNRRSERTRQLPQRSMREKQEDELSAHSETEVGPKVVATKEHFPRLPEHESFRRRHCQTCIVCDIEGDSGDKGPLVYCQGCTNTHHVKCLGPRGSRDHLVTKVAENNFVLQCRRCLGLARNKDHTAPDHGVCEGCHEHGKVSKPLRARLTTRQEQLQREENGGRDPITIVDVPLFSVDNVLFRCLSCQRAWHMYHLPKRAQATEDGEDEDELSEQQLALKRYERYRGNHTCKDCIEQPGEIGKLVAWRPVDLDAYIPGCTVDMMEESQKEYLVKWYNQSYFRATWKAGTWVWGVASGTMRSAFVKKDENQMPKMTTEDAIPEDFLRVDIIFDVQYSSVVRNTTKEIDLARVKEVNSAFMKFKGLGYDDAIWETPPSPQDGERWDDFKAAYEEFVMKRYVSIPPQSSLRRHLIAIRNQNFEAQLMKRSQPTSVTGGEMMGYQLEGLNWLYYQWFINQNAILADEMGLGKTIQVIAFFATLVQDHKCWPFLVVVPNSTCPNWRREIRKWAPNLRVVTYYGGREARKLAADYELFPKDEEHEEGQKKGKRPEVKNIRAHVVVTSYESVVEARLSLMRVPWQGLVVDEGQRLKNDQNLMYEALSKFKFPLKVLLTGTPLQNNARELFNLLQFLDPKIEASALEKKYETLTKENVPELHELVRPFFLRRTKAQVLSFLPAMAQIILPVTMSVVQKKVYKSILAKDPGLMKSVFSRVGPVATKDRHNLNNILMQLRKVLCHPFVYSREIEERGYDQAISHRNLVEASSKLQLLSIMLPKLQERGNRVLIFSQFLANLDIVEDFLDGLGLQHRRLDGTISSLEKQKRIDEYNAPSSPYFAFLLSTRAGGVGINLATADTVIIMDPDFNPHQDIQALSRAHRIGQKNKVLVFQMMTRGSAEEKIMQIGKKKMALDHVLIQKMDDEDDAGIDLESILRHGAAALFEDDTTGDISYDSTSVDKLLDRSQMENTSTGDDKSAESQFSFARIWANDTATLEDGLGGTESSTPTAATGVWDKILQERERQFEEEAAHNARQYGKGKRKRQTVDYGTGDNADNEIFSSPFKDNRSSNLNGESSDTDFQARNAESDDNDSEVSAVITPTDDVNGHRNGHMPLDPAFAQRAPPTMSQPTVKARPFKRVKVPGGPATHFNGDGPSDYVPLGGLPPTHLCSSCDEVHPMGWCRLKIAGVEHCGLCGLAHVGHGRTCPHLNSEAQVATMLGTLKESTESRELVEQAQKYLRMIRGDLVARKRKAEEKHQHQQQQQQGGSAAPGYANMNGTNDAGNGAGGGIFALEGRARFLPQYLLTGKDRQQSRPLPGYDQNGI